MLDGSAWVGDYGDLFGSRLASGNRVTPLLGLYGGSEGQLLKWLVAAFERYDGGDEAGLREDFHARGEGRLQLYGGLHLPPLAELEQAFRRYWSKIMKNEEWMQAVERWRKLPAEERRRRHLEAIPRHVANSMAMAGEPVDEQWIRERLAHLIKEAEGPPCDTES